MVLSLSVVALSENMQKPVESLITDTNNLTQLKVLAMRNLFSFSRCAGNTLLEE
jgi:hypothetical protein